MLEITELNIYILEKIIHEIAPELIDIYNIREDESEQQQIKTGRLHENRILGIMLKFFLEGKKKVTTREVESEYKKFFKDIARSTISTYLNILKRESTLYKERDGRLVYYILREDPPLDTSSFWFTRLFCVDPAYFYRAIYFSSIYSIAEIIVKTYMTKGVFNEIVESFKYLIGIIILYILKNRSSKCVFCQFSKQESYKDLLETINSALKNRTDVLPGELQETLKTNYAELPSFGGSWISDEEKEVKIIKQLIKYAIQYKKDMEYQAMVLDRRINTRVHEKIAEIINR